MYVSIDKGKREREEVTFKLQVKIKHNFVKFPLFRFHQCKIPNQHARRLMDLN